MSGFDKVAIDAQSVLTFEIHPFVEAIESAWKSASPPILRGIDFVILPITAGPTLTCTID